MTALHPTIPFSQSVSDAYLYLCAGPCLTSGWPGHSYNLQPAEKHQRGSHTICPAPLTVGSIHSSLWLSHHICYLKALPWSGAPSNTVLLCCFSCVEAQSRPEDGPPTHDTQDWGSRGWSQAVTSDSATLRKLHWTKQSRSLCPSKAWSLLGQDILNKDTY